MAIIDRIKAQPSLGSLHFAPSITAGLTGLFQPRKSAAEAILNRAPGGLPATLTGDPVYTTWGAILGPAAYLDTPVMETASFTLISVARKKTVAGGLALLSTLTGSASSVPSVTTSYRDATSATARYGFDVKSTPDTAVQYLGYDFPGADEGFECFASACDGAAIVNFMPRLPSTIGGGNPRSTALAGPRDAPTQAWRIGWIKAAGSSLFPGSTEHALHLIYDRALSELEIRTAYGEARRYFDPRGVVI